MLKRTNSEQQSRGCYYATEVYGSLRRRMLALGVDSVVLAVLVMGAFLVASGSDPDANLALALIALILSAYIYFVEVERSRFRTLGFRLTRLQVVSLSGERPTRLAMMTRLVIVWLGPLNLLLDLFWISDDENRQALRDKFAGTYVVKVDARPLGTGAVRYERYFFFGMNWSFREVVRGRI